jgi:hypothetical protein
MASVNIGKIQAVSLQRKRSRARRVMKQYEKEGESTVKIYGGQKWNFDIVFFIKENEGNKKRVFFQAKHDLEF